MSNVIKGQLATCLSDLQKCGMSNKASVSTGVLVGRCTKLIAVTSLTVLRLVNQINSSLQVCRELYEVMTQLAEQHSDKVFTIQGAPRSVQDPQETPTTELLLPDTSSLSPLPPTVTLGRCDWPEHRHHRRMIVHQRVQTQLPITCCVLSHLDRHDLNLPHR